MFMETSAKTAANVEEVGTHEYTHTDVHLKSHVHIASVFLQDKRKGRGGFSGCTECEIVSGALGYLICAIPFVYVINFWLTERGRERSKG